MNIVEVDHPTVLYMELSLPPGSALLDLKELRELESRPEVKSRTIVLAPRLDENGLPCLAAYDRQSDTLFVKRNV